MTRRSQQQHPPKLRVRAVRMVLEITPNYGSQWAVITAVRRSWVCGHGGDGAQVGAAGEVDAGQRPGTTTG